MQVWLPALGHWCHLRPADVYGDTTQPGLTVVQLARYIDYVKRRGGRPDG